MSYHLSGEDIGEDRINVLQSEWMAPGTVPCGKSGSGYCIIFREKVR